MKMIPRVGFSLVTALALTACAPNGAMVEHWAGRGSMGAFDVIVEMNVKKPLPGAAAREGQISVFGPAPLGYDFPLLINENVTLNAWNEQTLDFTFSLRGQEIHTALTRDGVREIARSADPDAMIAALLRLSDDGSLAASDLTGPYSNGDRTYAVMAREFGGLRLINAHTGSNRTLFAMGRRKFITSETLASADTFLPDLAFSRPSMRRPQEFIFTGVDEHKTFKRDSEIDFAPIEFTSGDLTLHGTVMLLASKAPVPGLVLVHGSGPIYGTALADRALAFSRMGIAVLIYDKRGSGRSEGDWKNATFEDLARDASAALAALESRPEIDAGRTGYQGHSQAGYVIPLATAMSDKAEFAIIVNGGSVSPAEQTLFDKHNDLKRAGFSGADITAALNFLKRIHSYARDRIGDYETLNRDYLDAIEQAWFSTLDLPTMPDFPSWERQPAILEEYAKELSFDPIKNQTMMEMPVLVVLGGADETVPAELATQGWRNSMADNAQFSLKVLPGAEHGMRGEDGALLPAYISAHRRWFEDQIFK